MLHLHSCGTASRAVGLKLPAWQRKHGLCLQVEFVRPVMQPCESGKDSLTPLQREDTLKEN